MSRESQGGSERIIVQAIKEQMDTLTGANFTVEQPEDGFRPHGETLQWYLRCPYLDQVDKMYHANSVWQYADGRICIESMSVGNYLEWVETDYGEEGAIKAMKTDFSNFNKSDSRNRLAAFFPLVESRIREYERIVQDSSGASDISLRVFFDARKEGVWFYLSAEFDAAMLDLHAVGEKVELGVNKLRKVVEKINSYETLRTKEIGRR